MDLLVAQPQAGHEQDKFQGKKNYRLTQSKGLLVFYQEQKFMIKANILMRMEMRYADQLCTMLGEVTV